LLKLILGRAGTGKTAYVLEEIRQKIEAGETGLLLIVPEQYSHDAERQLNAVCGDALSLHGETLSFTRLCGRVFLETGAPQRMLDSGGQILVMHRALETTAPHLKVFGSKTTRIEMLEKLLETIKEFKSNNITPEALEDISSKTTEPLASKLRDLSLIYSAYNALLQVHGGDASDRLTKLAELIGESTVGTCGMIYFDGFNDFTAQEQRVIEELLRKKAEITVCLSSDPEDSSEVFELTRNTANQLRQLAEKHGAAVTQGDGSLVFPLEHKRTVPLCSKPAELLFLEKHLFSHAQAEFKGQNSSISIYSAQSRYEECELAAQKILELVRSGYRWRDISVMARGWGEYETICENIFTKYGIPTFSGGRADILSKPTAAFIVAALDIVVAGWEYKHVFKYIKTGLADISADESAELENYVLKWNIRGKTWTREWILPPSGYGGEVDETGLARINGLRRRITEPIIRLSEGIGGVRSAEEKLRSLYSFLEEVRLPQRLNEKTADFGKRGEKRLADEYSQIWDIIINAMEQIYDLLGQTKLSADEFRKVFVLVLSSYDIGVIPVSLDRTSLGDMAMSRRRDMKCLIVLGATDENMPLFSKGGGALSDSDREGIQKLGFLMPSGLEQRFCREMNMLYSALTLPSEKLIVMHPSAGGARPSFIIKRLKVMFGETVAKTGGRFICPDSSGQMNRPPVLPVSLSPPIAKKLYGQELKLSATRVDKYYSCPYQHFLKSGLRLNPRIPADFDAPEAGVFIHYVLEHVSSEIKETKGFKNTDDQSCRRLTEHYIRQYIDKKLLGFEGKNARFIYLFRRLEEDVTRIALDMLEEIRNSDFEPLDFELDFKDFNSPVSLSGTVDRIDGWQSGEKLYLRVIDYKTGKKSFELSDVVYGRDLQMLIYLFALKEYGAARYGREIVPSGLLYAPARDMILKAPRHATDDDLKKQRTKELRREGLILNDPLVIDAMDAGVEKKFLPVKLTKEGAFTGDSLVSPEQIETLSEHVSNMLEKAAENILAGSIECSPYYKNDNDNACLYCEYASVCGFDEESGGRRRYIKKLKPAEVWEVLQLPRVESGV